MIFYDFEVFKYDWLVVFIDTESEEKTVIVNDRDKLIDFYDKHVKDIWSGFNVNHYDQYIFKAIMLGMNPKDVNDKIIVDGLDGWQISREFNKIPLVQYDCMTSRSYGLKTLEGFLGSNIKESDIDFNIDRKLTDDEIAQTIEYCTHDVEETIKVFIERIDTFNAMLGIIKAFPDITTLSDIGLTHARITAKVLGCKYENRDDEFDFFFLPCIQLNKYKCVYEWFESLAGNPNNLSYFDFYHQSYVIEVAKIPHVFGFGGLHGAPGEIKTKKDGTKYVVSMPKHCKGAIYHVDVSNYYPSLLIAWGLVTRSATNDNYQQMYKIRKELKYKQRHATSHEESRMYKKMQDPYKVMLNGLSGAMKDKGNAAFDPRNNNCMCINGQLMLLDLIEHLEIIPGFELIQSNTDGLIIQLPDTDEAFNMLDDICYDWECRMSTDKCEILLETDQIAEIYQKDVNNYLWIELDGNTERKGAYVKNLSRLDYDLPIINKALVEYMTNHTSVENTINSCDSLIEFQKIVKLSNKYEYVEHNNIRYDYKCYRVFASNDRHDGPILKCRLGNNPAKFGNTPDSCFIENNDVNDVMIQKKLDKKWYIDLAKKRLTDFGVVTH